MKRLLDALSEAARLGFQSAIVPRANLPRQSVEGIDVHGVDRIEQALETVREIGR